METVEEKATILTKEGADSLIALRRREIRLFWAIGNHIEYGTNEFPETKAFLSGLAETMQVDERTARAALVGLLEHGIVARYPNGGYFVNPWLFWIGPEETWKMGVRRIRAKVTRQTKRLNPTDTTQ